MCRTAHAVISVVICGIQMLVRVFMTFILMLENVFRLILQTLYNFISFLLQMASLVPICLVFLLTTRLKCFMCGGGGPCPINRGGGCDCLMSAAAIVLLFFIFRAVGLMDKIFYKIGYVQAPMTLDKFEPTPGDVRECSREESQEIHRFVPPTAVYVATTEGTGTTESGLHLPLRLVAATEDYSKISDSDGLFGTSTGTSTETETDIEDTKETQTETLENSITSASDDETTEIHKLLTGRRSAGYQSSSDNSVILSRSNLPTKKVFAKPNMVSETSTVTTIQLNDTFFYYTMFSTTPTTEFKDNLIQSTDALDSPSTVTEIMLIDNDNSQFVTEIYFNDIKNDGTGKDKQRSKEQSIIYPASYGKKRREIKRKEKNIKTTNMADTHYEEKTEQTLTPELQTETRDITESETVTPTLAGKSFKFFTNVLEYVSSS